MKFISLLLLCFIPAGFADNCHQLREKYQCPGEEKYPIHLTFDDGPADLTPGLLDTLKIENIQATFFVIANRIDCPLYKQKCRQGDTTACTSYQLCQERRETLTRTRQEGHMIGSHSYTHVRHTELPAPEMERQIVLSKQLLSSFFTTSPPLFRLPFGDGWFNREEKPTVMQTLEKHGFKHIPWEMSAYDWRKEDQQGDKILRTVINEICTKKQGLILFHDGDPDHEHIGRTFTGENIAKWIPAMRCVADFKPLSYFYKDLQIISQPTSKSSILNLTTKQ